MTLCAGTARGPFVFPDGGLTIDLMQCRIAMGSLLRCTIERLTASYEYS